MLKNVLSKLKESTFSVAPITLIAILVITTIFPLSTEFIVNLICGAILLIFGITLFSFGADTSMIVLGESIGRKLCEKNKLPLILICSFVIGFIITIAEPDLTVLSNQVENLSSLNSAWVFIIVVSLGVGIFLFLASLRLHFKIPLNIILFSSYAVIFILSIFVPDEFVPISFDSGSVTTGAISVPFLMAFGMGLCATRSDKSVEDDFGMVALASIGPIISVMIMSCFLGGGAESSLETEHIIHGFGEILVNNLGNVALTIAPLVLVFIVFQFFSLKLTSTKVLKILIGFGFVYVGIVMFLSGVEFGYLSLASTIGNKITESGNSLVAIPIGFVFGALAIIAEPALHILKKQVEKITMGIIKQKVIMITVSIGVSIAVALACVAVIYDLNILYFLIPVYAVCLALSFINTKLFTALAFDAGGVATGVMAVSFILPLVLGIGSNSGFGTIALIAAFPILSMQILGLVYKIVLIRSQKIYVSNLVTENVVVEFKWRDEIEDSVNSEKIIEFDF